MREFRRISNCVANDLTEIDKSAGKEEEEVDDLDDVEEEEGEVTTPYPSPPPHRASMRGGATKKAQKA